MCTCVHADELPRAHTDTDTDTDAHTGTDTDTDIDADADTQTPASTPTQTQTRTHHIQGRRASVLVRRGLPKVRKSQCSSTLTTHRQYQEEFSENITRP